MFPAVVVDLGNQVSTTEAAWVLAACNAAIARGTCELDGSADGPPRAVAIVRLQGRGRRVRIEVGLRESERAAWSVREIEFSAADPERERWRTVGLVLATLVGEAEAAAEVTAEVTVEPAAPATSSPEAAPPAEVAPAPPEATPPPLAPLRPAPATRAVRERDVAEADAPPAFPRHHGVFVGLGVLTSPAAPRGALPWGAALRGGVSFSSGWVLSLGADYSRAAFDEGGYALDLLRFAPGIGYRLAPAEHWSVGVTAAAGVRALWATSSRAGAVQQNAWSPIVAGSLDLWWQALPIGGLWAALELGSIGRVTRVLGRNAAFDSVVPAADARALFGLWTGL